MSTIGAVILFIFLIALFLPIVVYFLFGFCIVISILLYGAWKMFWKPVLRLLRSHLIEHRLPWNPKK